MSTEIFTLAQIIWDYHHINDILKKSNLILVLGSHDIRVADRWIELFKQWYGKYLLFSWGLGNLTRKNDLFIWTTEANLFAQRAIEQGINKDSIIIENKSTNTGENIIYSFELIKDMQIQNIILVQKPYMERRTLATFMKQRPGRKDIEILVTSPQISFENYPNEEISLEEIIHLIVWDLQRIIKYPRLWFQIYQEIPDEVIHAYQELIHLWFTKYLL